jgi:hypothetical protein
MYEARAEEDPDDAETHPVLPDGVDAFGFSVGWYRRYTFARFILAQRLILYIAVAIWVVGAVLAGLAIFIASHLHRFLFW